MINDPQENYVAPSLPVQVNNLRLHLLRGTSARFKYDFIRYRRRHNFHTQAA